MKNIILIATITLIIGACATKANLAPSNVRTKTYTLNSEKNKSQLFQSLNEWAALSFANSNKVIRLKDPKTGTLIAKSNVKCDALKLGNGFAKNERLEFTLTAKARNKKLSLTFSDIVGTSYGVWDNGLRPSSPKEAQKAFSNCIAPIVAGIKSKL